MSSTPTKKKLDRVRVAVLGASNCGKTALIVRFLTKRFIGEYERNKEFTYRQRVRVDGEMLTMEILDTATGEQDEDLHLQTSCLKWADGIILMYDITNRQSFAHVPKLHETILKSRSRNQLAPAVILIGNKNDLAAETRQVGYNEGQLFAESSDVVFHEISVRDSYEDVYSCFSDLVSELRSIISKQYVGTKKHSRWPSFKLLRKRSMSCPQ